MAKKNYQKITDCWNAKVESCGPEKSRIVFKGRNTQGTEVDVTVEVEDYFFPYMIKDMAGIARARVKSSVGRLNEISKSVESV